MRPLLLSLIALAAPTLGFAVEPPSGDPWQSQVTAAVRQLADDHPVGRVRAMQRLRLLADSPAQSLQLATEIRRYLSTAELPLETRMQLNAFANELPQPPVELPIKITKEELPKLVKQLSGPSYAERVGAAQRLRIALEDTRLLGPAWMEIVERWEVTNGEEQLFAKLRDVARCKFSVTDPALVNLPLITDAQITGWLKDLNDPEMAPSAKRRLEDALLRDDMVPRIAKTLEKAIDTGRVEGLALGTCRELQQLTHPAMVAEIWNYGRISTIQHLLIDVPQRPANAVRATHFDRADDESVRCVSGNSIAAGEYPVRIALPPTHPQSTAGRDGVMFHMINLPTPRRRLAYEFEAVEPEAARLKLISQKSCEYWLKEKYTLNEREIAMLVQLDAAEVSKFAGPYFKQIADGAWRDEPFVVEEVGPINRIDRGFPSDPALQTVRPTSRHGMFCAALAAYGTSDALPGLLAAIQAKRFLLDAQSTRYALPWVAILKIASRDSSAAVDKILASLIERADPLDLTAPDGPDVGATAAAYLLLRRGARPEEYGLESQNNRVAASELDQVRDPFGPDRIQSRQRAVPGEQWYRFQKPEQRSEVLKWWKARENGVAAR